MYISSLFAFAAVFTSLLANASPSPIQQRAAPTVCNGHAELCNRSYGNVTFIGTHNSYGNGSTIMDNQGKGVVDQLNDGVRTLQVQAHTTSTGEIRLCHSSCSLLDGGSLVAYLTKVQSWLSSNPNEVISILIVNDDSVAPSVFSAAFDQAGMTSNVYKPAAATVALTEWPTLGSMIESGQRVVVFMNYQSDFSSVPWIMDEFSNMWEDAYDVTDQTFACNVNRTSGSPSTTLMLTNHFLDSYGNILGIQAWIPNKDRLNETNAETGYGSIGQGAQNCNGLWGRNPNHILLDFYDSNGNAPFNVAADLNGVSRPSIQVTVSTFSKGSNAAASQAVASSLSQTGTRTGASATVATASMRSTSLSGGAQKLGDMSGLRWIVGAVGLAAFGLLV